MVGTPQLPLKYRRKATDDFNDIDVVPYSSYFAPCVEHDMAHHAASYPVPVPHFGTSFNPVSVPHSPVLSSHYEPSSSSPPRSLYTPEPPSSPLSDPFIASSSSSPRSKHFWDVAFNYGPGFPYKPRHSPAISKVKSSPTNPDFSHDHPIYSHRRSLSESAPTLVSDMDASEFSEDIDLLSVEGDMANMQSLESGKCVRIREDVGEEEKGIASEVGIFSVGHIDVKPGSNDCVPSVGMDIDIDIAAALLDLSRQVRIASSDAEKKPGPIAVKEERAVSVLIPDKGAEAEEEPTVAQDETPVLSASGDHQTNSNSSSSENIENQTMPIVEDVYMRREDGLETIQPVSESGNTSTESLGHETIDIADELSSRVIVEIPATLPLQCLTEGQVAREISHSKFPIETLPQITVGDEEEVPSLSDCDLVESNRPEPVNGGADSVEDEPVGETQTDTISHDDEELTKLETRSVLSVGEDRLDVFVLTTSNTTVALDCDVKGAMDDDKDDDARSLAALSICSSTLTPISSPLSSPIDPDDDPVLTFERLDSPEPAKLTSPESSASEYLSRSPLDMPDEMQIASRSMPRIKDLVGVPRDSTVFVSRQDKHPLPVPGPSSSVTESRALSIDIEEAFQTSSQSLSSTSVNEDRPTHEKGTCENESTRAVKAEAVKAKRDKPKMKDTRVEKVDKDGKEVQKGEQYVRTKPKGKAAERDIGGSLDERKPKPKGERKERRKRPREESATTPHLSRKSSPSPYCSTPDIAPSRPQKRSRKLDESATSDLEDVHVDASSSSRATSEAASSRASSVNPCSDSDSSEIGKHVHNVESDTSMEPELDVDKNVKEELCGLLIQCMALARASSMPATSLCRDLLRSNPHLAANRSRDALLDLINAVLHAHKVFGRIDREGLDAADKPLEPQWYYIPENDWDKDRATLLREMMPKKRNETKKHKQYYYRPVSKITRWDPEDDI